LKILNLILFKTVTISFISIDLIIKIFLTTFVLNQHTNKKKLSFRYNYFNSYNEEKNMKVLSIVKQKKKIKNNTLGIAHEKA
jgi:hypothetical protein